MNDNNNKEVVFILSFKFLKFEIITGPMCSDVFDIHLVYRKNNLPLASS